MRRTLALVLISALQLCISFPAVAGDCYDEPPNHSSYDNCDTCYQTLANALINTGDNKYRLSETFFPITDVPPVQVEVTYNGSYDLMNASVWYWLKGGFYVFQPLELFIYRSLYFSPPTWRKGNVTLELPDQCFNSSWNSFKYLTQRLKAYAQSQEAIPDIDNTYKGTGVDGNSVRISKDNINGDLSAAIVRAGYWVPFALVLILLAIGIIFMVCWHRCSLENVFEEKLSVITKNPSVRDNIVAALSLCVLTSVFIFCMDLASWVREDDDNLPSYYHKNVNSLYAFNFGFSLVSTVVPLIGVIVSFLVYRCYRKRKENNYNFDNKQAKSDVSECKALCIFIAILLCAGSTALLLSFHFQNILIAWTSDPFYASRIALYYGIFIFINFVSIRYAYNLSLSVMTEIQKMSIYKKYCKCFLGCHNCLEIFVVLASLLVTFVLVSGIIVIVITFVAHIPVNNSIEEAADGITTIYNGAVILIFVLIAYKVGNYFGNPFSLEDALKNAMKEITTTPFNPDSNVEWLKLAEEERMTEIMKALIHRQTFTGPRYCPMSSAVAFILKMARQGGQPIDLTTAQTTVLMNSLTTALSAAVKDAAGDDDFKANALTNALINALYTVVVNDPNVDLTALPTNEKTTTLKSSVKAILMEALIANESAPDLSDAQINNLKEDLKISLTPLGRE